MLNTKKFVFYYFYNDMHLQFIQPYFQFVNIYVTLRLLIGPKHGLTTKQWKASLTLKFKTLKSYFSVVISVFREVIEVYVHLAIL